MIVPSAADGVRQQAMEELGIDAQVEKVQGTIEMSSREAGPIAASAVHRR